MGLEYGMMLGSSNGVNAVQNITKQRLCAYAKPSSIQLFSCELGRSELVLSEVRT